MQKPGGYEAGFPRVRFSIVVPRFSMSLTVYQGVRN